MKAFSITLLCLITLAASAQRQRTVSLALTNNHTAYPFQSFSRLFTTEFHPGFQAGYGFNWRERKKHDLYQQFTAGYFYHRFVQHAITVYSAFGYRYKFSSRWYANASLGAGYLHSIPDAAVLKLNSDGNYENAKGIGRGQVMLQFALGPEYRFHVNKKPLTAFVQYQQMLQAPFINSYVPLLPYNSMALGLRTGLKTKKK